MYTNAQPERFSLGVRVEDCSWIPETGMFQLHTSSLSPPYSTAPTSDNNNNGVSVSNPSPSSSTTSARSVIVAGGRFWPLKNLETFLAPTTPLPSSSSSSSSLCSSFRPRVYDDTATTTKSTPITTSTNTITINGESESKSKSGSNNNNQSSHHHRLAWQFKRFEFGVRLEVPAENSFFSHETHWGACGRVRVCVRVY